MRSTLDVNSKGANKEKVSVISADNAETSQSSVAALESANTDGIFPGYL